MQKKLFSKKYFAKCFARDSTEHTAGHTDRGFVILIAVLISGLLVTIGLFIAHISIKEIALSSSSKDSQRAFYAADAAAECVLYHDLNIEQFATSSRSTSSSSSFRCNSEIVSVRRVVASSTYAISEIEVNFLDTASDTPAAFPYAKVQIKKEVVGSKEINTITAKGYNVQSTSAPNRVERAIQVTY